MTDLEKPTEWDPDANKRTQESELEQNELLEMAAKREALLANPFDPRTEVSADAKHIAGKIAHQASEDANKIVRHLWTIFVLLPIVSIILYEMIK